MSGQVVREWNNQESVHESGSLEGYPMQGSGSDVATGWMRPYLSDNVI